MSKRPGTTTTTLPAKTGVIRKSKPAKTIREDLCVRCGELIEYPISTTKRLIEVLTLVALGLTNDEIAGMLCITPSTVKVHVRNLFDVLHLHSRMEVASLASFVIHQGTIDGWHNWFQSALTEYDAPTLQDKSDGRRKAPGFGGFK